jgi:hypothetical protein
MRRKVLTVVVAINTYEEPAASIFRVEVALSNQTTCHIPEDLDFK